MSTLTITLERGAHRRPNRIVAGLRWARSGVEATLTMVTAVLLTPNRAALRRLGEMPLTVAAVGLVDTAAWQAPHWVGWLITGLSLVFVEHLISDDPPRSA